jgi:hypothetical protein
MYSKLVVFAYNSDAITRFANMFCAIGQDSALHVEVTSPPTHTHKSTEHWRILSDNLRPLPVAQRQKLSPRYTTIRRMATWICRWQTNVRVYCIPKANKAPNSWAHEMDWYGNMVMFHFSVFIRSLDSLWILACMSIKIFRCLACRIFRKKGK